MSRPAARWTALVPIKPVGERKTRLATRLSAEDRATLGQALFEHVAGVLRQTALIASVRVLAKTPPDGWNDGWIADHGRGLNAELEAARQSLPETPLLVLHADLPLVSETDLAALLAAAESCGCAIAPDRHGTGTNALALLGESRVRFCFGPGSFRLHAAGEANAAIVRRPGLALDVDTPGDLDQAIAAGYRAP